MTNLDDGRFEQDGDPHASTPHVRTERDSKKPAGGPADGDHAPEDDENTQEGRFDPTHPHPTSRHGQVPKG
jgi:hypothetical protein